MKSVQQIFSGKGNIIDVPMGEYEGPIRIDHACTVEGHGATIWVKSGTALFVDADRVRLKDLRLEITDKPEETVAVKLRNDTVLENVEIYGQEDRDGNVSAWKLPRMIDLGVFAAERVNEFHRRIVADCPCEISNNVHGLFLNPLKLTAGENDVEFKISSLMGDTVLYGDIVLKTGYGISKRIYISGRAEVGAKEYHERQAVPIQSGALDSGNQSDFGNSAHGGIDSSMGERVVMGQRLSLKNVKSLFTAFAGENIRVDIDPYAFQLYGNGKTRSDRDLIFFGNVQSSEEAVYIAEKNGLQGIGINLEKIAGDVERIVVTFAVYEDGTRPYSSFAEVINPVVRVWMDEDKSYVFPLSLGMEKVVNMFEVYRHKGEWKVKFVGAGFKSGLRVLCEQFGIDVR